MVITLGNQTLINDTVASTLAYQYTMIVSSNARFATKNSAAVY